jgi:hypothetical protein
VSPCAAAAQCQDGPIQRMPMLKTVPLTNCQVLADLRLDAETGEAACGAAAA